MLEIQKRIPFIEIIHHPITIDYKYELQSSKKLNTKSQGIDGIHFKNAKKVAPSIKRIITQLK